MATFDFYIDTVAGEFVTGPNSSTVVQASAIKLNYGDTPTLRIFLLTKVASATVPSGFDISPLLNNGLSLQLFLDNGLADTPAVYVNQLTWAPSSDNKYFTADLALTTPELLAIMTSALGGSCWLKIGYIQNGKAATVISKNITVGVGMPSVALSVATGQTALSVEVGNNTYFPLAPIAGQAIYLKSTGGTVVGLRAVDTGDGDTIIKPFKLS